MIIGVCGFKGNGKDTVANMIAAYNFRKVSMASSLKDTVAQMFGWPRHLLEGDTDESREWREIPDPYWTSRLAGKGIFSNDSIITPRIALQRVGTDLIRKYVDDDFFIMRLGRIEGFIVISDVRFINEMKQCDVVIRVVSRDYTQEEIELMPISEKEHLSYGHDYVIQNKGSIDDLEFKVHKVMSDIQYKYAL